jgi:hypothetical protein
MAERVMGGVGTTVLYEDDRVRVWELRLGPKEDSPIHRHELDYVLVQISGGKIAAVPEADSAGPYNDYLEADVEPGAVVAIARGGVELARNLGDREYLEVIVELKDPPVS